MQERQEDKDSLFKVAQLVSAFDHQVKVNFIEKILETKGDINYKIPVHALNESNQDYAGSTALHFIQKYDSKIQELKVIQLLLKYGADITIKNNEKQTALRKTLDKITSSKTQHNKLSDDRVDEILSTHVKKSITKNPGDRHGLTHFHIACMADHSAAAQFFLNIGVPVDLVVRKNSPIFPDCSPLLIAAKSSALEVVKVLLNHGANQYMKDKERMTAIHWLIERNRKIIEFLTLEEYKYLNKNGFLELKVNQQIVYLLLNSNKIDSSNIMDEIGLTDFHIACTIEDRSVVKRLLDQVPQIDQQVDANSHLWSGYTALHFAAHFNLGTVKLLLNKGANIMIECKNGCTPFDICLERYAVKDIHSIMLTQPNWRSITLLDGKTKLLELVSAMQDIDQFKSFLDTYIDDINTSVSKDSSLWPGYTLLHLAVLFSEQTKNRSNYTLVTNGSVRFQVDSSFELINECLIRGANVTAQCLFGCTPLHLAFRYKKIITIKILLNFHHSAVNPVDKYNVSHLHIACAAEDEDVIEKLLQSGAKLDLQVLSNFKFHRVIYSVCSKNEHISAGSTPLHIAVLTRNYKVTQMLVDNGADVNAVDKHGVTPIHLLLLERDMDLKIIKVLLSANLKEVIITGMGLSHLHVASFFRNVDAVKRLLDLGADVNARLGCGLGFKNLFNRNSSRDEYDGFSCELFAGATALHIAIWQESLEVGKLLIKHGADILAKNASGSFPLHSIIINETSHMPSDHSQVYMTMFFELLSQNETLMRRVEEESGMTAIHMAAFQADAFAVKKLIESGVNVNARMNDNASELAGYTPLHMLITLSSNFIVHTDSKTNDVVETMKLLLASGADLTLSDAKGNTPLHLIIKYWNYAGEFDIGLIELMLNGLKNFHVNPVGEDGLSHFHIACLQDNAPIIKKFVEHGVDVKAPINFFNSRDFFPGKLALHLINQAYWNNKSLPQVETIDFLLEHGANVNSEDVNGDTPLHDAVKVAPDRVDIFQRFIRAGTDLNKLNVLCETPFATLLLSSKSTPKVVEFFIEHGCCVNDFNSVSQQGYLARPLCTLFKNRNDRTEIYETLFKSPDITQSDAKGRTAIHNIVSLNGSDSSNDAVIEKYYSSLIKRLCNMGCDIDSQDQTGRTALHFATRFKNNIAITGLLLNGADVNIVDRYGNTAFTYSFDLCEYRQSEKEYQHIAIIETFYIHIKKIQFLQLSLNDINKNMLPRILLLNDNNEFNVDRLYRFSEEINRIVSFEFEEGLISFRLFDMLYETGTVAAYPIMGYDRRHVINTFFQNIEIYLTDYPETIGVFKLQYRKAIKRMKLINPATESLKVSVGFPVPDICCSIMLRFLSNADLENLISSTNNVSVSSYCTQKIC